LNILFDVIYYLLFFILGIYLVISRDAWASKLVESQKMVDFIFRRSIVSKENEIIYAKRLTLVIGLVFIVFGLLKAYKTVITFLR
jgi:hypothetical protein